MNNTEPDTDFVPLVRSLFTGISFLLALGGQILLFTGPERLNLGLILSAAAVTIFLLSRLWNPPLWMSSAVKGWTFSRRALLVIIATCLAVMTVVLAFSFDAFGRVNK